MLPESVSACKVLRTEQRIEHPSRQRTKHPSRQRIKHLSRHPFHANSWMACIAPHGQTQRVPAKLIDDYISLHKKGECTKQEGWTMEKEKRKKPFQSIYVGRPQLQACHRNLYRTRRGKGCVATNTFASFAIFQMSHACLHA